MLWKFKYLKLDQSMKELSKNDESIEAALTFTNSEIESLKKGAENQKMNIRNDRSRIVKVEQKCSDQGV